MTFMLQGRYFWQNADPVSYQGWKPKNADIKSDLNLCQMSETTTDSCRHFPNIRNKSTKENKNDKTSTVMVLLNMAQPHWISTPCHQKVTAGVVCALPYKLKEIDFSINDKNFFWVCSKGEIQINVTCLKLKWYTFMLYPDS